ncbi:hypothetical protein ACX3YD_26225 [Pseudomonas fluorescens group sp. PF-1]
MKNKRSQAVLRIIPGIKKPTDQAGFFVEDCGKAIHSSDVVAVQTIGTIGSDGVALQTIRAIGSNGVALQTIRAIGGDGIALQTIRAIGSNGVALQAIRAIGGDGVALQAIRAIGGNGVALQAIRAIGSNGVALQAVGAISSHPILDQAIGATFRHATFNQAIRAAFGDDRLSRGSGESVYCKNRESDAEKSLAFHGGVLRVLLGGYGADVTPRNFYENFIGMMVNIDGIDRASGIPLAGVMMQSSDGSCAVKSGFYTG